MTQTHSVNVFRTDYDCTLNGVSSPKNAEGKSFILVDGPVTDEIIENHPTDKYVLLTVVRRNIGGKAYVHAEPVQLDGGKKWFMSGGNFIKTCDSRFSEQICQYPISLHDRYEG